MRMKNVNRRKSKIIEQIQRRVSLRKADARKLDMLAIEENSSDSDSADLNRSNSEEKHMEHQS